MKAKTGETEWASEVQPGITFMMRHEPEAPNLPWCLYMKGIPTYPELTFRAGASSSEEGAIKTVNLFLEQGVWYAELTPAYSVTPRR